MKVTFNTTVEIDTVTKYLKKIKELELDKNRQTEKLMKEWIGDKSESEWEEKCEECGAIYSNKLGYCPQCKLNEKIDEEKELDKEIKEKEKERFSSMNTIKELEDIDDENILDNDFLLKKIIILREQGLRYGIKDIRDWFEWKQINGNKADK